MNHEAIENTGKPKNYKRIGFNWWQKIGSIVFLIAFSIWGLPLINLGIHYLKWKSHQIDDYNIQIGFIGGGFIRADFFEPIMNRPIIYNSSEKPVEHLYQQALHNVFTLCSNYTEFDIDYHYPKQVGCADFRHLQIITVVDFEVITNDQ